MLQSTRFQGPQEVHGHGDRGADHVLEQQGWTAGAEDPIGNGRQLKVWIHRGGDPTQLPPLLEQLQKAPQIPLGSLRGKGCCHIRLQHLTGFCLLWRTRWCIAVVQISYFHTF